jgi:3-methyladenine DNA glycosylase AlkD
MIPESILTQLQSLADEKVYAHNLKHGAGTRQFGVKMVDIRALAKKIKTNHALGLALWETDMLEARFLAVLILKPNALSAAELERMVTVATYPHLADWLNSYVVKVHPENEHLRQAWMLAGVSPMCARAGWSLTAGRVARAPEGLDLSALLDRLEAEMPTAPSAVQWTMNTTLAYIGIHHPDLRERALALGENMGIYRDYPVSKGCTSPFAPIWIREMVGRMG